MRSNNNDEIQRRLFLTFSDLVILSALKGRNLTGYGIQKHILKKVGDIASPSTIYRTLSFLERKGLITCLRDEIGRVYGLTDEGKRAADTLNYITPEVNRYMKLLLGEKR